MKLIILALVLSAVAIALPQISSSAPNPSNPKTINPTPTSPKVVGELPKDGLKNLPWNDFDKFASQLGFDPAKATPDASGQKCQTAPNGRFCFSPSGGSFALGHPGGAFSGENWNPFPGGVGSTGGLLVGGIGSADDIATPSNEFTA